MAQSSCGPRRAGLVEGERLSDRVHYPDDSLGECLYRKFQREVAGCVSQLHK